MENNIKWKVTVSCMTFNQSAYITDTMDGFAMQKTNFPFVCTIVDDASTDGEQTVIREYVEKNFDLSDKTIAYTQETDYAHIMFAQHKVNKNCYFSVLFLKENHYSIKKSKFPYLKPWRDEVEYIAFCEGDDYWIDSNKLQAQFDFMNAHPDCSLISHGHKVLNSKSGITKNSVYSEVIELKIDKLLLNHTIISVASMFYRNSLLTKHDLLLSKIPLYDYAIKAILAIQGKVYVLPKVMSVYRLYAVSSWTRTASQDSTFMIKHYQTSINCLNEIDAYFDFKYHFEIHNDIIRRETEIAILNFDFKKLNIEPYLGFYKQKSFLKRCSIHLRKYSPFIYGFIMFLKNKLN